MSSTKNSTEEKVAIISSSPLELRHRVIFVMCRNQLISAYNACARLGDDEASETLSQEQINECYIPLSATEKLELINRIIANIEDVKNTLWAAVMSADAGERNNPNPEGFS
ncbi:MAG: hypothetical protein MHPDNHAH_03268 [Anaerolineales bacterium]|nr:hypothetical protein [Anaerolineales bacterium]WKZ48429.1 MAG: hypothetical protein QY306_03545 [Anaerolineales bacterium]